MEGVRGREDQGPSPNRPTGCGQAGGGVSTGEAHPQHPGAPPSSCPGASGCSPANGWTGSRGAGPALQLWSFAQERAACWARHLCPCGLPTASPSVSTGGASGPCPQCCGVSLASEPLAGGFQAPPSSLAPAGRTPPRLQSMGGRLGGMWLTGIIDRLHPRIFSH